MWRVRKVSVQSWKLLDDLEGFQLIWKVSEQSVNFQPGNFLYNLEVYNQSGKFLDSLERQRYVNTWTKSLKLATNKVAKERFMHFWRLCRESDLRTFGIYVAETIYALCPESFCP